jgi:large subunit ribosomal protein L10
MNRHEKQELVSQLKEQFQKNDSAFLLNYQGLSVKQLQELRRSVSKVNGNFKVAKVRLVRKAIQDIDSIKGLDQYCKNQLGIVFVPDHAHEVLKELHNFSKKHPILSFVAGRFDNKLLQKELLIRFAELPSREVLLAQVAVTLNNMIAQVARLAQALKEKRTSDDTGNR